LKRVEVGLKELKRLEIPLPGGVRGGFLILRYLGSKFKVQNSRLVAGYREREIQYYIITGNNNFIIYS
jgi:hypothetical protein